MKNGNAYSINVEGNDLHNALMRMHGDVYASKYEIGHFYKSGLGFNVESYGTRYTDFVDDTVSHFETALADSNIGDEAIFREVRDFLLF